MTGGASRAAMIGGSLDVQTAADYGTVVILDLPHRSSTVGSVIGD